MVQQAPPPRSPSPAATPARKPRPPRQGEWTHAKMAAFLRELAATQSVSRAARSVGMGRQSAYKLRQRLAPFAQAWDEVAAMLELSGPIGPHAGREPCPLCGTVPGRPAMAARR